MSAPDASGAAPAGARLIVRDLRREFPTGGGLHGVSMEVRDGEFFVLLGPSGCGKSTLLRLIAGLDPPDSGTIEITGGAARGASRGKVAMVFQNYALYPHMTAFENIAFPLRLGRVAHDEIVRRVEASARLAGLSIDLHRVPAQLSGGERQRVALARALVREPGVILMDEPLSNLDAKLRSALRAELKDFQRRTHQTVVYVTHDQLEAMTLADRMAVLRDGRIEQLGPPAAIYARPANEFVAGFVGQPPMNLLRATVAPGGDALLSGGSTIAIAPPAGAGAELVVGVRAEDLTLDASGAHESVGFDAVIERVEFSGARYLAAGRVGPSPIAFEASRPVAPGDRVRLYAQRARLHFFDAATGLRIEPN
jgi:multiple sugar transport system ATP-binding protein